MSSSRRRATVLATALCLAVPALAGPAQAAERVSVDSAEGQASGFSYVPRPDADGDVVVFASGAADLVPDDTNNAFDVFVRDRTAGTTERVSVDSAGNEGNAGGTVGSISADGRFVALESYSTDLVPGGDVNGGNADIFVHDRLTGVTLRISESSLGVQSNGHSTDPAISGDGRYVSFTSTATNLVPGDTNEQPDTFVHDRLTGVTELVSVDSTGNQGDGHSFASAISADGRYVAFCSFASNLVAGDTNSAFDIFVHDRQTGTTERVSVSSTGAQGDAGSGLSPGISADGRLVSFTSSAATLVPGDTNGGSDIFVHDRQSGTTERVSVDSAGNQADGSSFSSGPYDLSGSGRYVTFASNATNLVAGDTNDTFDVFVHDRDSGTTERVSVDGAGNEGNNSSFGGALSADGGVAAFYSNATNLVAGDTNNDADAFIADRDVASGPATVTLAPPDAVNPVGTSHSVTATVRDADGEPFAGARVRFAVTGSVATTGSCTTATDGTCTFTYAGPDFPGADAISAYADTDDDGTHDDGEPAVPAAATKAWVLPTASAGHVTGGGQVWNAAHSDRVAFGFNAKGDGTTAKGNCNVEDPTAGVHLKCTDVDVITRTGNSARIYGDATVNGTPTTFRIDVTDNGEPGRDDVFRITTASGYAVGGTLSKGNVQVH
jgi:Tol biopolymer transport system component